MALTVTAVRGASSVWGNKKSRVYTVTFDSSYPDGGESLVPSDVGLRTIEQAIPHGPAVKADGSLANPVSYDHTNKKLLAFESAGDGDSLDEVNDTASLDTFAVRMTFIGF